MIKGCWELFFVLELYPPHYGGFNRCCGTASMAVRAARTAETMIADYVTASSGENFWANFFATNRYVSGSIIIIIYIVIATILAYLLSGYIAKIYMGKETYMDRFSGPIVRAFERMLGEDAKKDMDFREYFSTILIFSLFLGIIGFAVIYFQHYLPFSFSNNHMTPSLIFNTVASFLTTTVSCAVPFTTALSSELNLTLPEGLSLTPIIITSGL